MLLLLHSHPSCLSSKFHMIFQLTSVHINASTNSSNYSFIILALPVISTSMIFPLGSPVLFLDFMVWFPCTSIHIMTKWSFPLYEIFKWLFSSFVIIHFYSHATQEYFILINKSKETYRTVLSSRVGKILYSIFFCCSRSICAWGNDAIVMRMLWAYGMSNTESLKYCHLWIDAIGIVIKKIFFENVSECRCSLKFW